MKAKVRSARNRALVKVVTINRMGRIADRSHSICHHASQCGSYHSSPYHSHNDPPLRVPHYSQHQPIKRSHLAGGASFAGEWRKGVKVIRALGLKKIERRSAKAQWHIF